MKLFRVLNALGWLLGSLVSQADWVMTSLAGQGIRGYSGDGGPATIAKLNQPSGLALDRANTLYIADSYNHCIRKINRQGIISTLAGDGISGYNGDGGPAKMARFNEPRGLDLDAGGNLYVADSKNHVIRKIDDQGLISTVAGNATAGYSGDGGAATRAQLNLPVDIIVAKSHHLYLVESANHVIRKIDAQGIITTVVGNNTPGYHGDGKLAMAAQLYYPQGMVLDKEGNGYIADSKNQVVRKVDTQGIISTVAGNATSGFRDGLATMAQLNFPSSVAIDLQGNLYISDLQNFRIRQLNADHHLVTVAGDGTQGNGGDGKIASQAQLNQVLDLLVDDQGNLYLADSGNQKIRKVSFQ